jgi:hypothetical protein
MLEDNPSRRWPLIVQHDEEISTVFAALDYDMLCRNVPVGPNQGERSADVAAEPSVVNESNGSQIELELPGHGVFEVARRSSRHRRQDARAGENVPRPASPDLAAYRWRSA